MIGFKVEPMGRADDPIRMSLAKYCEDKGLTISELSMRAGLDPRAGWLFLSGRARLRSDRLAALVAAAEGRLWIPSDGAPLAPMTPARSA